MTKLKWFFPVTLLGYSHYGDVREYGFRLDLRTELSWFTYDWGYGFTVVLLGFGVEVTRCSF